VSGFQVASALSERDEQVIPSKEFKLGFAGFVDEIDGPFD
jgi:hypothetical protein